MDVHPSAWIAPNAVVTGDVTIGAGSRVLYGAVLNGMSARARDGAGPRELRAIADRALAAWPAA